MELSTGCTVDNKYKVLETLGTGGFATAYKAIHTALDRFVVIKVYSAEMAKSDEIRQRIRREAKATKSVDHPSVIKIYDHGFLADDRPYLVFEYVNGQPLDAYVQNQGGRLDSATVRNIFLKSAAGLNAIHGADVVHRDIAPGNILIVESDVDEIGVKIIDFGLIRPSGNWGQKTMQLTQAGFTMGNPQFMSPEQCSARMVDARSDIYSLGCAMIYAWTGRPPFQSDTAVGFMQAHVNEPFKLSQLNSEDKTERTLAKVILRCLEKSPEHRYSSCSALLADLESAAELEWTPISPSESAAAESETLVAESGRGRTAVDFRILTMAVLAAGVAIIVLAANHSNFLNRGAATMPVGARPAAELDLKLSPKVPVVDAPAMWMIGRGLYKKEYQGLVYNLDGRSLSQPVPIGDNEASFQLGASRGNKVHLGWGDRFVSTDAEKLRKLNLSSAPSQSLYWRAFAPPGMGEQLEISLHHPVVRHPCLRTAPNGHLYASVILLDAEMSSTNGSIVVFDTTPGGEFFILPQGEFALQSYQGFAFDSQGQVVVGGNGWGAGKLYLWKILRNGQFQKWFAGNAHVAAWDIDGEDNVVFVSEDGLLGRNSDGVLERFVQPAGVSLECICTVR